MAVAEPKEGEGISLTGSKLLILLLKFIINFHGLLQLKSNFI